LQSLALQPVTLNIAQSNTTFYFTWNTATNQVYQIQYTTDLVSSNWHNLGAPITATNNSAAATDTVAPGSQRFYRVSWTP